MKLILENWREFLKKGVSRRDLPLPDIECNQDLVSQGIIPPNELYMGLKAAAKHFELGEKAATNHRLFSYYYEEKHIRSDPEPEPPKPGQFATDDIGDFVYVTNSSNYYTLKHPDDFDEEAWQNAVREIDRIRGKCGEPIYWRHGLEFETYGDAAKTKPLDRPYELRDIKTNKLFISMLRQKRMPAESSLRNLKSTGQLIESWRRYLNESNIKDYQIFCDMDGVLVDFDSATSKILNDLIDNPEEHSDDEELYKTILKAKKEADKAGIEEITGEHFNFGSPYKEVTSLMFSALAGNKDYWVEMEWLEGGKELWDFIEPYKPIILTAPIKGSEASKSGKEEWCAEHLGAEVEVIVDEEKWKYAKYEGKTGLLIDDREKNVRLFKDEGGKAIQHTSLDQTKEELEGI